MHDAGESPNPRAKRKRRSPLRWLKSTSRRTFLVYPVLVVAIELAWRGGDLPFVPWGVPLLVWGYLQYRLGGAYRTKHGGGGPGIEVPPERIVDTGIYGWIRHPMYLGHMIFMAGLAITFRSLPAVALLLFHLFWFNARAREDEWHLEKRFGNAYRDYKDRTNRWIPFVY